MSAYIELVKKLQGLAERRDRAAILAMVTSDLEYHYHVGSKPVNGPEGLGRFLDNYWGRSKDGVWKIETFAQSGDTLLMEGWEEYTDTTNGNRVLNRYMGAMEFRDGKIARWRDYFQLNRPPAA
jgi:limonene-1,2-epoxide hydrolase